MFVSAVGLVMLMSGFSVESLSERSWVQSSLPETEVACPMRFEFKGLKYRIYNPCPTKSRSGVIEWGTFQVEGKKLLFSDRYVLEGGGSIFGDDAQPFEMVVEEMSETSILFRYKGKQLRIVSNGVPNW